MPGGSAEMLRKEVVEGNVLRHLEKCKDRITNLKRILSDPAEIISRVDRNAAERVMRDLRDAIGRTQK